jgi:secretion system chaperone SscA
MSAPTTVNETGGAAARDEQAVLREFFSRGGSVRMLTDVDERDLELLYAHATALFDANEFAGARNHYLLLSRLDHWNFDYWFALGLCHQRLGEHADAILSMSRAAMIRLDDPRPPFFTGVSCRLLGNADSARKAFEAALQWCGQLPQHAALRESAEEQLALCAVKESES